MIPIPLVEVVNLYIISQTTLSQLAFTSLRKTLVNDQLIRLRRAHSALKTKLEGLEGELEMMNKMCQGLRDAVDSNRGLREGFADFGGTVAKDAADKLEKQEESLEEVVVKVEVYKEKVEKRIEEAREMSAFCEREIERIERRRWERWRDFWNEF